MKLIETLKKLEYDLITPNTKRVKWQFYPSEASCITAKGKVIGSCLRQMWYQWANTKPTNEISQHLINTIIWGYGIEKHIVGKFYRAGMIHGFETDWKYKAVLDNDIMVSGRLDGLLKKDTKIIGLEIKTYEGEPKYLFDRPKEHHLLQTFLYLVTYPKVKLPYIIIIYRQRPGHRFAQTKDIQHRIDYVKLSNKTYPIVNGQIYKDITLEGIIDRYKLIKNYVASNKIPPKDYTGGRGFCSWCIYRERCKRED